MVNQIAAAASARVSSANFAEIDGSKPSAADNKNQIAWSLRDFDPRTREGRDLTEAMMMTVVKDVGHSRGYTAKQVREAQVQFQKAFGSTPDGTAPSVKEATEAYIQSKNMNAEQATDFRSIVKRASGELVNNQQSILTSDARNNQSLPASLRQSRADLLNRGAADMGAQLDGTRSIYSKLDRWTIFDFSNFQLR
jgi:hypothetical protein